MSACNEILTAPRRLYRASNGLVLAAYETEVEPSALESLREFVVPKHLSADWKPRTTSDFGPLFLQHLPASNYGQVLYTHCSVNSQSGETTWFGFSCYEELQFFRTLMLADGIGPKSAFKVLDATPWDKIAAVLAAGDQDGFACLPCIGPKTATKLLPIVFAGKPATKPVVTIDADAVAALCSLGMQKSAAQERVRKVLTNTTGLATDEVVRLCLKNR